MKTSYKLIGIDHEHPITEESDADFLALFERAALLALKDIGTLNEPQYRQAEETLRHRRRTDVPAR